MRFPSVQTLIQSVLQTLKRFPVTILFVLIACVYAIRIIHTPYADLADRSKHDYVNIIASSYLGMLLSLVLTIFSERKNLSVKIIALLQVLSACLVIAYYYSLPDHFSIIHIEQYILFMIGLHLMVAFVPFISKGEINGFWQYNKVLLLRFLTAFLYSSVIYIGLSLALLAMDKLFGLNIDFKWYGDLWVCIAGIFNTIFFLAGFPGDYAGLETKQDYPKGLKIFTQYVLIPIITVYILILYAYMFKILFSRQWPYGWVSYLVLAFAIAGILSLLLIQPIRNEENNKWILGYNKFFYIAMCPLIILLFLAIERRIGDYGITEERYFDFVLACWLALVCLYFLFSKTKNIKRIPISLCIFVLFSSFGPWGAFSVSLRSQMSRLNHYLEKNKLLSVGKIIPAKDSIPTKDENEIISIVTYIVNIHGYHELQGLFSQNLDSLILPKGQKAPEYNSFEQPGKILALMHLKDFPSVALDKEYFNYTGEPGKAATLLTGYDYLISGYEMTSSYKDSNSISKTFQVPGQALQIVALPDTGKILMQIPNGSPLLVDLAGLVRSIHDSSSYTSGTVNQDRLVLSSENKDLAIKCIVQDIRGDISKDKVQVSHLTADILVRIKKL